MVDSNIGRPSGEPLFEIAVYRVTPVRWREELAALDEQVREALAPHQDHLPQTSYDNHFMQMQDALRSQIGHFPYGQAVGWLRLLHDGPGPVVKGYSYKLPQRQLRQRFHQTHFREVGKEVEVSLGRSTSNAEFVEQLRSAIVATTRRRQVFARRWLDMAAFDKVAPYLDWRTMLSPPE